MTPPSTPPSLTGRRVLVTGAGGALGPVAASAAVTAGARVALWDHGPDRIAAIAARLTDGPGAVEHLAALDLRDADAVDRAMAEAAAALGGLDAIWHLVGGYRGGMPMEDEPLEDFDLLIDLGIRTTVNVARASVAPLVASGRGRFASVSAPAATRPSGRNAAYSIAKAGSDAAVLALADRLKGTVATANVVVVNAIATGEMVEAEPDRNWSTHTTAEHLADTLVWLSGDVAATMSGQRLSLMGSA